jgi:pyrroloquinoline-quinone synthase
MMNERLPGHEAIPCWVANRWYYQAIIPMQGGAILSNCSDREIRRAWIVRILERDGAGAAEGGLETWIHLDEAAGLQRQEFTSFQHVLPRCVSR